MSRLTVSVLFLFGTIFGQEPRVAPVLEVASVRPRQGPLGRLFMFSSAGRRALYEAYGVMQLVMEAYHLKAYQVAFAPSLPRDRTNYDVTVQVEGDRSPSRDEFRRILQGVLSERFRLKFHEETKEMPVFALVVGKGGPKLRESKADVEFSARHGVKGRNVNLEAFGFTMEDLAADIANSVIQNRPVVDKTGLEGKYDIQLEVTPEYNATRDPQPGDMSIFSAVQEQLGLKLEAQKDQVKILIIDYIEKPSEN